MNPDDFIKAAPAIVKGTAVVGATLPLSAYVKRIFGPAADGLAEMWRDRIRLYGYEKQLKCVKKAEEMAKEAGFNPQAVPPKILFPLLEGASLEDNDDIHTMWAALLANAASPKSAEKVRPGFIALLRQMTPDEAAILNWIYRDGLRQRKERPALLPEWYCGDLQAAYDRLCSPRTTNPLNLAICLDSLEAAFLLHRYQVSVDERPVTKVRLTDRGRAFASACKSPALVPEA